MAEKKIIESGTLRITFYPYEKGKIDGWNNAINKVIEIITSRRYMISNPSYLFNENKLEAHIEALINIGQEIEKLKKGVKNAKQKG